MEQFIKVEFGKLRAHHKKHFNKLEKKIKRLDLWIKIAVLILVILQILNILKN